MKIEPGTWVTLLPPLEQSLVVATYQWDKNGISRGASHT
jgi:hypothetical protein